MSEKEEAVQIMATAIEFGHRDGPRAQANRALTALEAKGYKLVKRADLERMKELAEKAAALHGISHPQAPYRGEKE